VEEKSKMRRWAIRLIVAAAVFGLALLPVFGQDRGQGQALSGQITGQVRYADGGQPAFNVLVSCDAFGQGFIGQAMTDRNGKFQFTSLKPDQYRIVIRLSGYTEEQQETELYTSPTQYLQFRLKADASGRTPTATPAVLDANVPVEARKEFEKADALLATEKPESIEEGVRHLEKAVAIYPKFVEAELKLGTAFMDLKQWDRAEQALRKALEIDPKAANALFALGELYLHQKRDDEAEKVLTQGLQIENRSYQGHLALGRVYWDMSSKLKDGPQARPLLEKSYEQAKSALELNPNLAAAHLLKGNLLLRVRRAEDAQHEFGEYLRLEPKGEFAEQTRAVVEKIKIALAEQKKP
jgi:tetratricopeptide (TPR) repeat protein